MKPIQDCSKMDKQDNKYRKWYKVWWKLVMSFVASLGIVWGIFETTYAITEWWHKEYLKEKKILELEHRVEELHKEDSSQNSKIKYFDNYIKNKNESYSVGFRVFKQKHFESGGIIHKKMYRDWDGAWHEIHYDKKASEFYGIDYYYYIEKETGEKIYCW